MLKPQTGENSTSPRFATKPSASSAGATVKRSAFSSSVFVCLPAAHVWYITLNTEENPRPAIWGRIFSWRRAPTRNDRKNPARIRCRRAHRLVCVVCVLRSIQSASRIYPRSRIHEHIQKRWRAGQRRVKRTCFRSLHSARSRR